MSVFDLDELKFSPTASLFEGGPRAGVDISVFVVRTPPGAAVELHVHPYAETFVLLEGSGRWSAGDDVVELQANQMLVVPPESSISTLTRRAERGRQARTPQVSRVAATTPSATLGIS